MTKPSTEDMATTMPPRDATMTWSPLRQAELAVIRERTCLTRRSLLTSKDTLQGRMVEDRPTPAAF